MEHHRADQLPLLDSELDFLAEQVPLAHAHVIELGCGAARFARDLLAREPDSEITGLEVDATQMASNRAQVPHPRLHWVEAGAQAIPFGAGQFDGALMLKSLHHIPVAVMDQALAEVARVLRPGGWLYVSEPIYGGALNEVVKLYNEEGVVRAQAQAALDRAVASGAWVQTLEHRFAQHSHFVDFEDFARRMMNASYRDDQIDAALYQRVANAYAPHQGPAGAHFVRPMHARLLRRV
jgi:ubiquinone/menaquinone biosynthesis C-methylase UbiE